MVSVHWMAEKPEWQAKGTKTGVHSLWDWRAEGNKHGKDSHILGLPDTLLLPESRARENTQWNMHYPGTLHWRKIMQSEQWGKKHTFSRNQANEPSDTRKESLFFLQCLQSSLLANIYIMPASKEKCWKGLDPFSQSRLWRENLELRGNKSITSTVYNKK